MEWKDVASTVGKFAPMLGTLIGGPAGTLIGSMISSALGVENTPDAIHAAIQNNPDAAIKLAQIEAENRVELQKLATDQAKAEIAAQAQASSDINKSIQVEAASEHWPTYGWRPFIGFAVGFNVIASSVLVLAVFVPIMFGNKDAAAAVAQLPLVLGALAGINGTVLPILGIASYFRGKMQSDPTVASNKKG